MIKSSNRKEHLVHLTEKRPWGSFTVLQEGFGFKIKLIEISAHKRLSLQRHKFRAEHWVVVSGTAKAISGQKTSWVHSNESIYIPKSKKHRLENTTNQPLRIVEVQTGSYLGEDDIERFDDDFKR
jgi:mannose-6-phosphate isomerase-like protein (cupin superfamily)